MCMEHVINQKPEAPVSLKQDVCSISAVSSPECQCWWQVDSPEKSKCRCQFSDEYPPFGFSSMHIHQAARPPGDFIPNCVLLSSPPKPPWHHGTDEGMSKWMPVLVRAALVAQTAQLYSSTLREILSRIPLAPRFRCGLPWTAGLCSVSEACSDSRSSYLCQVFPHQVKSAFTW